MVGFIGALSSSLCILILVFITLLLSYINSLLPNTSMFKVSESTERFPITTYFVTNALKDELIRTIEIIQMSDDNKPVTLMLGCTFGFDIDKNIAKNITIYNAIKINSFNLNLPVTIFDDPIFKDDALNYCFLDFTRDNENG